jgi:hypothetical protein
MASFSVQFADGSSHTYDNVPAGVTQEQVNVRARTDYPDKEITEVAAGVAPEAPKPMPAAPEPSFGENVLGGAQTALGMTNAFLSSPLGHAVEIAGGAGYGLNKLRGIANDFGRSMNPNNPYMQNGQVMRNGQPGYNSPAAQGPVKPTTTFTNGANPAFDQALSKSPSMLGQMAQRVAPFVQGASKALAPAMIAKELFYTSPEEVQQLQQMRQSGTSLKDTMNKKYQEINTAIREAAARKALGQ